MSNSQGQRREIIRLAEVPRSSTPEPALKRQRTSRTNSKNIANIPRAARPRRTVGNAEPTVDVTDDSARSSDPLEHQVGNAEPVRQVTHDSAGPSDPLERQVDIAEPAAEVTHDSARSSYPLEHRPEERVDNAEPVRQVTYDSARSSDPLGHRAATPGGDPEEAAVEEARVTSSPAHVHDTSEPEDRPLMATSWILPAVSTSTGVDTGAMPMMDLEQAAWDASVIPVSTGTDTDGHSRAVVPATGDNSTDGTISTRTIENDVGATSEQESSSSRLISVGGSFDIVGGGPRTVTAPTRVVDSSERSSEPMDGTVAAASGVQAVDHLGRVRTQMFRDYECKMNHLIHFDSLLSYNDILANKYKLT